MNVQHRTWNAEHPTPFLPLCGSAALREDPPAMPARPRPSLEELRAVLKPAAAWLARRALRRAAEAALGAAIVAIPFVTLWAVEATQRWMEGRP